MTYICGGEGEMWERKEQVWTRCTVAWNGGESERLEGTRDDAEQFENHDDEVEAGNVWKALIAYSEKNFPMCCSIGEEQEEMQGLISGHAYSLLAVRNVT